MHKSVYQSCVLSKIIDVPTFKLHIQKLSYGTGVDGDIIVKKGQKVKKGDIIATFDKNFISVNTHASVDGEIKEISKSTSVNARTGGYVQIVSKKSVANDNYEKNTSFEENDKDLEIDEANLTQLDEANLLSSIDKNLNTAFDKECVSSFSSLKDHLQKMGVVQADNLSQTAYEILKEDASYLLINALNDGFYKLEDVSVMYHEFDKIISCVLLLNRCIKFKRCIIAINKQFKNLFDTRLIQLQESGYINIKVHYTNLKTQKCNEQKLIEKAIGQKISDYSYFSLRAQTALHIYNAIMFSTPQTKCYITLHGDALKQNYILSAPLGADIEDILSYYDMQKCTYEEFKKREEIAYQNYKLTQDIREQIKKGVTEEEKKEIIEKRKNANKVLFDFIKFEYLYSSSLSSSLFARYGKNKKLQTSLNFLTDKSCSEVHILTYKELKKVKKKHKL